MSPEDLNIVRGLPLLAGLPEDRLGRLLTGAVPRVHPKGQVLFLQDDPADGFYVVLSGWVKLFVERSDGEEAVLGVFTRGESFAEAVMFIGGRYPASAQVVEDARLLRFSYRPFSDWIHAEPAAALNMLASMSRHLHHLVREVTQLKTRTASQRVADFLVRLFPTREGSAVVALPYDKSLIAARLGMKPESLSRVLGGLRKLGVKSEQNRVVIPDVALLHDYADSGRPVDAFRDQMVRARGAD